MRPRQNGRHFADDIFKCIFLNEDAWISLKISLKFVTKVQINNIPSLVQIMAWRRPGDKPLSEPMMVSLLTHICVTRSQWVKYYLSSTIFSRVLVLSVLRVTQFIATLRTSYTRPNSFQQTWFSTISPLLCSPVSDFLHMKPRCTTPLGGPVLVYTNSLWKFFI